MAVGSHNSASADEDLSKFIVEEHSDNPGKGGQSEVRESELAGAEHVVEERNIGDQDLKHTDKDQTQVGSVVDHALLRNRQSSGLCDDQDGPLYKGNADQIGSLRMFQSFSSVANLGASHS